MAKKISTVETNAPEKDTRAELINFIKAKAPTLFDRDPVLTGNVGAFADEIIKLFE